MDTYIVTKGDTLYSISKRFYTTVANLINLNPGINPNILYLGQRINVPQIVSPRPTYYIVRTGETLSDIAKRYNLSENILLDANLKYLSPQEVKAGDKIVIPSLYPAPGVITYLVKPGETLYSIANKFNTTIAFLLRINPKIPNSGYLIAWNDIFVPLNISSIPNWCFYNVESTDDISNIYRYDAYGANKTFMSTIGYPYPSISHNAKIYVYSKIIPANIILHDICSDLTKVLVSGMITFGLSFSYNDARVVFTSEDGALYAVDVTGLLREIYDKSMNIRRAVFLPGDKQLVGGVDFDTGYIPEGAKYSVHYDIIATFNENGSNFKRFDDFYVEPYSKFTFSQDGRYIVAKMTTNNTPVILDLWTGNYSMLPTYSRMGTWAPDKSLLSMVSYNYTNPKLNYIIYIVDPFGRIVKGLTPRNFPDEVRWTPSPDWLYYSSNNANADYLINIVTGREIKLATRMATAEMSKICTPCQ